MVAEQIVSRGIENPAIIQAMLEVPREIFLPEELFHLAYADAALPIIEDQTISQPFVVAAMVDALRLSPTDRVLEVGTGSGYAAAVMSRVAGEVYTVERHEALVRYAAERIDMLSYRNVHIRHGDGTLGWPEHAPYDAISVAAAGPKIPTTLREQLAVGGRMVIPVGEQDGDQYLVRVTRISRDEYTEERLDPVRFVPLVGAEGWRNDIRLAQDHGNEGSRKVSVLLPPRQVSALIKDAAEPFDSLETADLGPLLDRMDGCRIVLIGEATHGTSEFYRMRARITQALIEQRDFNIVAAEADWPDASRVDAYARGREGRPRRAIDVFTRFPTWMWRNLEVLDFVEWLRDYNNGLEPDSRVGFFGLDLYSLYESVHEVLHYLEGIDPEMARLARARYECLTPFLGEPAEYGAAALTGRHQLCEEDAVRMLRDLLQKRIEYIQEDDERFFDAARNAAIVANAEKYYRAMYYGSADSWNLRDTHMFDTLEALLDFHGPDSRAVVWAHNSHVGDAAATEMYERGEINIGHLARRRFGTGAYLVGFGTDHGTVAAASNWGEPVEIKRVRPSREDSYEWLCHETHLPSFLLHLREPANTAMRRELSNMRLERAIGVIYRPDTELMSHYFQSRLPAQFDEYIWFDETCAVTPIGRPHAPRLTSGHPFALLDE
jgi:protein-L-isoaspartate(D-aspartate) O-methyltransferase